MNQPANNNAANGAHPRPSPPSLDAAAEEQIEKIVDSILADNRQRLRDMEDLAIRHIKTMGEECRGAIKAAFEQAAVAGFRERLLWMAIGALGAIIGFVLGSWLRLAGSL